jgi:hypothetical protein
MWNTWKSVWYSVLNGGRGDSEVRQSEFKYWLCQLLVVGPEQVA